MRAHERSEWVPRGIEGRSPLRILGATLGASRGREHLVELERSEQLYLVIRDRFRTNTQHKLRALKEK